MPLGNAASHMRAARRVIGVKEDDVGLYPQFAEADDAILEPAKIGGVEARGIPVARPFAGANKGVGRDRFDVGKDQHPHLVERRALQRRSEEHTSELQSLMRISYAVYCLKNKNTQATTE